MQRVTAVLPQPGGRKCRLGCYAELGIQRETSALTAERDVDPAWCSCPHMFLRPRLFIPQVEIRMMPKENTYIPQQSSLPRANAILCYNRAEHRTAPWYALECCRRSSVRSRMRRSHTQSQAR